MTNETSGTRDFEKKESEILTLSQGAFGIVYPVYWSALGILKDAIDILITEYASSPPTGESKYALALLMLINRSIQHLESIRLLTERGLYGDAFILLRSVMSDLSMCNYLSIHPELLDLFLNENEKDYQENKEFKNAFNEGEIERSLIARGIEPAKNGFRVLSKTSHASSFGSQLFGYRPDGGNKYHFNYGPKFDAEKGLLLMLILTSGHYDFLVQILAYEEQKGNGKLFGEWKGIAERVRQLKSELEIVDGALKATIINFSHKKLRPLS